MIPYVDLAAQHAPLEDRLLEAVRRVLRHGQFILGPEVGELECRLAGRLDVADVVGVGNGTDALTLALRLRGIGPGDEVITVSHSFVATANAIALTGARPVFVDIDPETMVMDPDQLPAAMSSRTRAVVPVHLNGYPCDLERIAAFCDAHELALIEDCAQAFDTRFRGKSVGSTDLGAFSLHPLKSLSACGDAGFVAARSREDGRRLRELRNLGLIDRDHCASISGNSRLDTLQAALLLVKLEHADEWQEARRAHARAYREALPEWVQLPPDHPEHRITYSAFVIRSPRRDALIGHMRDRGIDVKVHYPLAIHEQVVFAGAHRYPLPVTERVVREIMSLPVSPELSVVDRRRVIDALHSAGEES